MRVTSEGVLILDTFKWSGTQARVPGSFEKFPAGAYVCQIISMEFKTMKSDDIQAIFYVDVAEGDYTGHFAKRAKNAGGVWPFAAQFKRYVTKDGEYSKDFKGFVEFLTRQNPEFKMPEGQIAPIDFIGLLCGFTFGEEEYEADDGSIKTSCKLQFPHSVNDVREGKVKTPELKKLDDSKRKYKPNDSAFVDFSGTEVPDEAVPFK